MTPKMAAFDGIASDYDRDFSHRILGTLLRERVHQETATYWAPGQRVLELGCGTGEDALWLARQGLRVTATDIAPKMLQIAAQKLAGHHATFSVVDAADPVLPPGPFDRVFSNFGALNCVESRRPLAASLSQVVPAGGLLVWVLMGPYCPWEWVWALRHGRPEAIGRRKKGALADIGSASPVQVWFPSLAELTAELAPWFKPVSSRPIGLLLPPSYLASWVDRWPLLARNMASIESYIAKWESTAWLSDHYLAVFQRTLPEVRRP